MDFLPKEIEAYSSAHTEAENDLLTQLNRQTWEQVLMPRMLSGHIQGRILAMMSQMIKPRYILEIGTYTGYSALCLAEGLQADGELHTVDINEELGPMVKSYFAKSPFAAQLHYHSVDARQWLGTVNKDWDMVFLDADKVSYQYYYDYLIPRLKSGAFIIADNVLWSGKVLEPEAHLADKDLQALVAFNAHVHQDTSVENVLFPVRDGLMVIRKK